MDEFYQNLFEIESELPSKVSKYDFILEKLYRVCFYISIYFCNVSNKYFTIFPSIISMLLSITKDPSWKSLDVLIEKSYSADEFLRNFINNLFKKLWLIFIKQISYNFPEEEYPIEKAKNLPELTLENIPNVIPVSTFDELKFLLDHSHDSDFKCNSQINHILSTNMPDMPFDIVSQFPIRVIAAREHFQRVIKYAAKM